MTTDPGNGQVLVDLALFARRRRAWRLHLGAVLDRLLEEPRLRIEGISGTSAGATHAAVLVDGYAEGGETGARARLERFWESVSVLSAGTLDSFPHNGAVVMLLSVSA